MKWIFWILIFLLVCLAGLVIIVHIRSAKDEIEIGIYEEEYNDHSYIIFTYPETNQFSVVHSPDCICHTDIIDYGN